VGRISSVLDTVWISFDTARKAYAAVALYVVACSKTPEHEGQGFAGKKDYQIGEEVGVKGGIRVEVVVVCPVISIPCKPRDELRHHPLCTAAPTVQPLWVVQPDAVCEVGGLTPDLSYGDLGIFLGGGQTEKFVH